MYDALLANIDTADERAPVLLRKLKLERGAYNLLTLHRAENTENVEAVLALLDALQQAGRPVLFPVHPRTRNLLPDEVQQRYPAVRIVEPLGYLEMLAAERHASTILTDSGGVQKEAFYLNVPCLTLRHETEWPETLHAGANVLVGMDPVRVLTALRAPSPGVDRSNQPFGSGNAAERIVAELLSAVTRAKESKPTAAVA